MDRPPSPHSSSPAMGASVPFVGRRPEVGSLKDALAAAVAGAPRTTSCLFPSPSTLLVPCWHEPNRALVVGAPTEALRYP